MRPPTADGKLQTNPLHEVVIPDWYGSGRHVQKLNPETVSMLQPVLDSFLGGHHILDLNDLEISWGSTPGDVAAYTFHNRITINWTQWQGLTPLGKLQLLAHEATHALQYKLMGSAAFLTRYNSEHDRPDNYAWSGDPMPKDPMDPRYTLDQIGRSVEKEVERRYGGS
jgi:hypothetical protein